MHVHSLKKGQEFVTPSAARDSNLSMAPSCPAESVEDAVLEHILDCDICLDIICDPRIATKLCEYQCPEYRRLIAQSSKI